LLEGFVRVQVSGAVHVPPGMSLRWFLLYPSNVLDSSSSKGLRRHGNPTFLHFPHNRIEVVMDWINLISNFIVFCTAIAAAWLGWHNDFARATYTLAWAIFCLQTIKIKPKRK
jgi:hypothetical protein